MFCVALDCKQPLVFLISQSRVCARCEGRAAKPRGTRAPTQEKTFIFICLHYVKLSIITFLLLYNQASVYSISSSLPLY